MHLGTRVEDIPGNPLRQGQTMWAECSPRQEAGLAWDWVEIGGGVLALADPMSVVTNLRLVGAQGEVLTAQQSALHLNSLVHQLPWQDEVWRRMHRA